MSATRAAKKAQERHEPQRRERYGENWARADAENREWRVGADGVAEVDRLLTLVEDDPDAAALHRERLVGQTKVVQAKLDALDADRARLLVERRRLFNMTLAAGGRTSEIAAVTGLTMPAIKHQTDSRK